MEREFRPGQSMRGTAASLVVVGVVAALVVVFFATTRLSRGNDPNLGAVPSVQATEPPATSVRPRRDEAEIRQIAHSHLTSLAETAVSRGLIPETISIQSVANTAWSDVAKLERRISGPEPGSVDASRIVWVVRGDGTFLVLRTPPGRDPFVGKTGYLLIDDETGEILGLGTP